MTEQRQQQRFPLRLPARIQADGAIQSAARYVVGMTRNISSGGAYLHLDDPLPVGTRAALTIFLRAPSHHNHAGEGQVKVKGTVLRSECGGMALRFDRDFVLAPAG